MLYLLLSSKFTVKCCPKVVQRMFYFLEPCNTGVDFYRKSPRYQILCFCKSASATSLPSHTLHLDLEDRWNQSVNSSGLGLFIFYQNYSSTDEVVLSLVLTKAFQMHKIYPQSEAEHEVFCDQPQQVLASPPPVPSFSRLHA